MWEELYEAYYTELVKYGTAMSKSHELSEDLAQETFMRAMMNIDTLEDMSSNKRRAWLYRTFKNLYFDRYRRDALENRYVQSFQSDVFEEPKLAEIESAIVLQSVSAQDRTLFSLRYFEGYTAVEIAEMLNIPPGTVRSRLSRCRKYLKDNIEI